jgi:uncharacterized membrane protein YbaN (DUF454 family)
MYKVVPSLVGFLRLALQIVSVTSDVLSSVKKLVTSFAANQRSAKAQKSHLLPQVCFFDDFKLQEEAAMMLLLVWLM